MSLISEVVLYLLVGEQSFMALYGALEKELNGVGGAQTGNVLLLRLPFGFLAAALATSSDYAIWLCVPCSASHVKCLSVLDFSRAAGLSLDAT